MNRVIVRRPKRKKRTRGPTLVAVAVAMLAGAAVVALVLVLSGGSADAPPGERTPTLTAAQVAATPTSPAGPDLSRRAGGLSEGAVPADRVASDPPERRFPLPLRAHAGVEDYFGTPRLYGQIHGGVDFSLAGLSSAPVFAVCDGIVAKVDETARHGPHLEVDCGDGWAFVVGFLQTIAVSEGDGVKLGDEVGSGRPGAHLHIELRYEGAVVDPANHMDLPRRVVIPPTPTPTPTPTNTPTVPVPPTQGGGQPAAPTSTPTPGPTATPTATPTVTNTPTITPTPTWTPTPTRTPLPRPATPTPPPVAR